LKEYMARLSENDIPPTTGMKTGERHPEGEKPSNRIKREHRERAFRARTKDRGSLEKRHLKKLRNYKFC